jgi:hypothetical protein
MMGRHKIYTDDYINSYVKKHDLGVTLLETPTNVKSIVRWQCNKCHKTFQSSFFSFLQAGARKVKRHYDPCNLCRMERRSHKATMPQTGSEDHAWLSGALIAGAIIHGGRSQTENTTVSITSLDNLLKGIGIETLRIHKNAIMEAYFTSNRS